MTTQPDQNYRDELVKQTKTPAAFVDLYLSIEQQITEAVNGRAVINVAGDVIHTIFSFIDDADADVVDQLVGTTAANVELSKQAKQLAADSRRQLVRLVELEELARIQQQQIAASVRNTASYQKSVIERDEIIADKSRLLRSQNEIINGLHELRRRQVGELNVAVITLFETLGISNVDVNDETLNRIAARASGAHYALNVTRQPATLTTRFEVTRIKGELA